MNFERELEALNRASLQGLEWAAFRDRFRQAILTALVTTLAESAPDQKTAAILEIRRAHDILYVAHRLRQEAVRQRRPVPPDLLTAVLRIMAKPNAGSTSDQRRSPEEERWVVAAKVNWHKLLKKSDFAKGAAATTMPVKIPPVILRKLREMVRLLDEEAAQNSVAASELATLAEPLRECLQRFEKP